MSILSAQDQKNAQEPSKDSPFWIRLLKQVFLAFGVSAAVLALYLLVVNDRKQDNIVGKYAYASKDGNYIGIIEGRGRKSGVKVFFIKQASSIISVDERYVIIKDNAPKYD